MVASMSERIALDYDDVDQAFPEVEPGLTPFGSRVLVQKRSPRTRLKSGLVVPHETQETEFWNTQVAKVITDRKSTRLNSSHMSESRMPSSA